MENKVQQCCDNLRKVAVVEVYEGKTQVQAYGFMAGDRNTPQMEVRFKETFGETNLETCKLRYVIIDDVGSLIVGETSIGTNNTGIINLPNQLFAGERRMKVQLTLASCDGSKILNLQQFTDLKVINNLTPEIAQPVYDILINKIYDLSEEAIRVIGEGIKGLGDTYAKSKASLEDYLITAQSGGNADFLRGYLPTNFNRVEGTIAELQASRKYKLGEIIEVLGYYSAGDGAGHKRLISNTDDGSGVQLTNGLWANMQTKRTLSKWWGLKGDGITDETSLLNKAMNFGDSLTITKGTYLVTKSELEKLPNTGLFPKDNFELTFEVGSTIYLENSVDVSHILCLGLKPNGARAKNITINNANIDCNANSFSNGIGLGNCEDVRIINPTIRNCIGVSYIPNPYIDIPYREFNGGGRGLTVQGKNKNVFISNYKAVNCDFALDLVGFKKTEEKDSYGIVCQGLITEDCRCIIEQDGTNPQGIITDRNLIDTSGVVVSNVSFKNCGKSTPYRVNACFQRVNGGTGNELPFATAGKEGTTYANENWRFIPYDVSLQEWSSVSQYNIGDKVKYTDDGTNSALFSFAGGASGITLSNIRGRNDANYGKIGAIFRGTGKGIDIADVSVQVETDTVYRFGAVPFLNITNRGYAIAQYITLNNIKNFGITYNLFKADNPIKGSTENTETCPLNFRCEGLGVFNDSIVKYAGNEFFNKNNSKRNFIEFYDLLYGGQLTSNLSDLSSAAKIQLDANTIAERNIINGLSIDDITFKGDKDTKLNVYDSYVEFTNNGFRVSDGKWNSGNYMRIGSIRFWLDSQDRLRQSNRNPMSDTDGIIVGKGYVTLDSLNTPYHVEKMKSEGVYTDFISYMDEKTIYDNHMRNQDTVDGVNNLMVLEEPIPSETLLKFKEKYLG